MIAAALDDCDLIRGRRYGRALDAVDELHVIYNPCDRALKRYWALEKGRSAIGYTGLSHGRNRASVRQVNVSGLLGKRHRWSYYEQARVLALYVRVALKKATPLPAAGGPELALSATDNAD
jgi:hypothetical protein